MELIDDLGNPVRRAGEEGRIVATGFDNAVMPFIRYDTGDRGVLSAHTECSCGFRGTSLEGITGREQDLIVLSDGTHVSLTAFIFGQHLAAFDKIREMQIAQDVPGEIEIRIVRNTEYTVADENNILKVLTKSVDNKLKISITYINSVPKTPRGKNIFFFPVLKNKTVKAW